jgi:hypothetical protein
MTTQATTPAKSAKPIVSVRVAPNVKPEVLLGIIQGIGGRYGCQTCGILGVDVRLYGDPVEFPEITKIPGVQSVYSE